ncbi:MAG: hypothetical protein JW953_12870 [Anaerolineae bacterium]|nr:hypothetical protein [Anaerolineae bacterium]
MMVRTRLAGMKQAVVVLGGHLPGLGRKQKKRANSVVFGQTIAIGAYG